MYVKKIYIAEDGTEFEHELQCRVHDAKIYKQKYASTLNPFIEFFNKGGKPADFNIREFAYAYVKKIPDWNEDSAVLDAFDAIAPEGLIKAIQSVDEIGWYISTDDNTWYSWNKQEEFHTTMKHMLGRMEGHLD